MSEVHITIDGKKLTVPDFLSVRKAALKNGIYVPGLCSHPELNPFKPFNWSEQVWQGTAEFVHDDSIDAEEDFPHCNLCLVSIDGGEPQRACTTKVAEGMEIRTMGADLIKARQGSLKNVLANHPHACLTCAQWEGCDRLQCSMDVPVEQRCCELLGKCELGKVAQFIGIPNDTPAYRPLDRPVIETEPLIRRNYELCINCLRCVRVCRDVREVDALGAAAYQGAVKVGTNAGPTLPESLCRFCGACVEVCPTGALMDQPGVEVLINGMAPCSAKCPLNVDVPGYLELIAEGLEFEALELIRQRAVLPGVLGYACFHPCEDNCRRKEIDDPASICALKRYASDMAGDKEPEIVKSPPTGRKIAVIGGGPAGIAAAAELLKRGHKVVIFERDEKLGGMLRQTIPNFRLPERVIERDLKYLEALGLNSRTGIDFGGDNDLNKLKADGYEAVIIAVGLSRPVSLGLEGEELAGVAYGLDFLRKAADKKIDKLSGDVVVIGGGNVAVDAAMTAKRMGALKVKMICLEQPGEMPAYSDELDAAVEEGVQISHGWGVERIEGKDGSVSKVILKKCVSVFDENGKFNPKYDAATQTEVPVDYLIIAIGQKIEDSLKDCLKKPEDVFIAGDVATGPSSIVKAMADGVRAAKEANAFLGGYPAPEYKKYAKESKRIGRDPEFHLRTRAEPEQLSVPERIKTTDVFYSTLTAEQAREEAARCMRCNLRATLLKAPPPPDPWFEFNSDLVAQIPEIEGVLILADEDKKSVKIAGSSDLKSAFDELIDEDFDAAFCRWEINPMYTQRESELIQAHLQAYGEIPGGDELDDLF